MNLTVYFSKAGENFFPGGIRAVDKGNTAYAAEYVQKAVGGDLIEIVPSEGYPFDYKECAKRAKTEIDTAARPEIKVNVEDMGKYDVIYVCFPNWCGTAPMCVFTFLELYDLTGKKIALLCTNEGSGLANSEADLKKCCIGAEVVAGLSVKGHQVQESEAVIAAWAKGVQ